MNPPDHNDSLKKESKERDLTNPPNEVVSLIKEQKDVLLAMYCENRAHARHYEGQRATVSNIIMLATVALIGIIAQGDLTFEDWPLTASIALLGGFGAVFTTLYQTRITRYEKRADECHLALDVLLFGWPGESHKLEPRTLTAIVKEADLPEDAKIYANNDRPRFRRERMAWFRKLWPVAIAVLALIATYGARHSEQSKPSALEITRDSSGCLKLEPKN